MKIAISIPDDVFRSAERLVRESGRSRSEVYATAVREYVAQHAADEVTEALDRVMVGLAADDSEVRFRDAAAWRLLHASEW